ncbi:unnamed protein product [Durusdinium trenchii]|uniref:Uncharacterized protein n=2 Tax=Durusdinium trenchii TaxID=1381693 RepID=A0ABP0KBV4_9DINO
MLLLNLLTMAMAVADTCQVEQVKGRNSCDTKKVTLEHYAILMLYYLTPLRIERDEFTLKVALPPHAELNKGFAKDIYVRMPELINMTCRFETTGTDDFPNACSGKLTGEVMMLRPGLPTIPGDKVQDVPADLVKKRESFTYGMALYIYSSYNHKDRKVHELIELKFALGPDGICSVECQLTSGQCFGMSAALSRPPRAPVHCPAPPAVNGTSPRFCQIKAKPVPPRLGVGSAVVIVLLVLGVLGLGCTFVFHWRRQRVVEEQALRRAQEVELS